MAPRLGGGTETFTYDGFGQRVKKTPWSGNATVYVYDIFGQLAAEYANGTSWSRDYIRWAGGQVIATENASGVGLCTTCYLSYDHLGSVRLVTDQNGVVKARHDFLPYGEEVPASTAGRSSQFGLTTDAAQKFTGQIRDQEATMDYFNARYFVAPLSRFTSPDPGNAGVDLTDPQTWNAYAYVRNSPLHMVDPSGMDPITVSCPDCTVTVDGGSTDGIDPWDFPFYNRFFGYDPNSPLFTDIVIARAPAVTESTSSGGFSFPPKNGTCGNLPAGTSPAFCAALQQGLQNALNALKRKPCGKFYGGQGPQTLDATQYRFLDLHNPTTGAATITPNSVFVNSQGPYMSYTPTPGQTGPFGRYWTQGQFRGFILLHELGHQLSPVTGFGPDAGSPLNQQQSQRVLNACF